jgi:hypothetical protein
MSDDRDESPWSTLPEAVAAIAGVYQVLHQDIGVGILTGVARIVTNL